MGQCVPLSHVWGEGYHASWWEHLTCLVHYVTPSSHGASLISWFHVVKGSSWTKNMFSQPNKLFLLDKSIKGWTLALIFKTNWCWPTSHHEAAVSEETQWICFAIFFFSAAARTFTVYFSHRWLHMEFRLSLQIKFWLKSFLSYFLICYITE